MRQSNIEKAMRESHIEKAMRKSDIETTTIIYQPRYQAYNLRLYEASPERAIEELLLMHLDASCGESNMKSIAFAIYISA